MQKFPSFSVAGTSNFTTQRQNKTVPVHPSLYQCWYTCGTALRSYNFPILFSILSGLKYLERCLQVPFSIPPFLSADCVPGGSGISAFPVIQRFKGSLGHSKAGKSELQNLSFYFKTVVTLFKGSELAMQLQSIITLSWFSQTTEGRRL